MSPGIRTLPFRCGTSIPHPHLGVKVEVQPTLGVLNPGSHALPLRETETSSALIPTVTAQPTTCVIMSALDDIHPHGFKTRHTGLRQDVTHKPRDPHAPFPNGGGEMRVPHWIVAPGSR